MSIKYTMNDGKKVEIEVDGKKYKRKAIKTHFVKQGESYIDIMEKYVKPNYKEGDFISISEKIIALISDAYKTFNNPTLSIAYCIFIVSPTPTPVSG